ncbi:MAG: hypothetical protein ACLTCI_02535 [[Clostridium] nexile]
MSIKNRIPKEFYKLFNSKYVEYFQRILIALYEQSASSYSLLGLTEGECQTRSRWRFLHLRWILVKVT